MASIPPAIGKYQVIDRLGEGGMGTLYLARDPGLDRLVAVKVLRGDFDDPELRERFSREARTVSNLIHDNIVIIYEYGDFEGQPFIAMQYVAGESLAEIIRRRAYLTLERKLEMIDELCAGMAFAHRAKIVHRDLKPANIMVDADRGQIKILDFGIARNVEANATLYTQVIGTPSYMSPEQAGGLRVDQRSDIFAIGVVAYELLSYRKAFDGDSRIAIERRILNEDPVPLPQVCPGIDPGIVSIVLKALAKDPGARYQDLKAMRSDLARAIDRAGRSNEGATIVVSPAAPSSGPSTPSPSPRLEERRARQIQIHLKAAAAALSEENYDAAIESCEHILLLDAHHETGLALLEKARAGADRVIVERHLTQARAHLRSGALTLADQELLAAIKIAGTDPAVRTLQRDLQQARRDAERAMERAAAAEASLVRGRASLEDGAYESALRAATEALAHVPDSREALALKARANEAIEARARERELERLATKAVADGRARFDAGHHADAIDALERFSPAHPIVTAALEELRDKRAAIGEQRRREEERRRAEEDRRRAEEERRRAEEARHRERLERASAWLATGRDRLVAADYSGALQAIAEAEGLEPDLAGLAKLRAEVLARKAAAEAAAERQRTIASHLSEAERLIGTFELDKALVEANAALAIDAADARASQLAARIRRAIEQRQRETEEREARANEALRLKQQEEDRRRHEEERKRAEERERELRRARAAALLASGEQRLASGDYDGALAAVADAERLEPSLPELTRLRERARAARDAADAAAREAARIKQEIADRVADAERLLENLALDQALEQADAALALAPADRNVQRLRSKIQRATEDRAKAEAAKRQAALDAERREKEQAERQHQEALKREALEKERLARAARLAELLATGSRQLESRDFDATFRTIDEAERLDPKSADLKVLRSRALAERAAAEAAAESLAKRQRQIAAKVASAERLLREKKLEKAFTEVEAAIALDPDAVNAKALLVRIQRALDDRRRDDEAASASKIDATLVSTRTLDEGPPFEITQVRQDQPTQIVIARPRAESVPPTVTRSRRPPLLFAGIAMLIVAAGAAAIWKWQSTPQPPPVTPQPLITTPTPVPGPAPPPPPVDPLDSYRRQLAATDVQQQPDRVLSIVVEALRIKKDDAQLLQRLNGLFSDAQASAVREKNGADQVSASTLASQTYAQAEADRQAGRQRGPTDQTGTAVRRSWEARDLFAKAASEAKAAQQAAADEALKKQQEEAQRRAQQEEAQRKAQQEEVQRKAREEAQRKAQQEEAQRRAQQDAQRKAQDEEARRKADADRRRQQDDQNIRDVVERYRSAFINRDAGALLRVGGPAFDFDDYLSYKLEITGIDVDVRGDSAIVRCTRRIEAVLKRGGRQSPRTVPTTLTVRRSGDSWIIVGIN